MRLPAIVALASAITCLPSVALAAASSDLPTLAVPPAKAADPLVAQAVAAAIAAEARRFPVRAVSVPDAFAGCAAAACLKGLAADFLLVSEVAQTANQWVLSVDLLLVKQAKSLMTASKKAPLSAPVAELAADAAAEVLMGIGEPTSPRPPRAAVASAPEPAPAAPAPTAAPDAAPVQDPTTTADASPGEPAEKVPEPAPSEPPAQSAPAAPSQQPAPVAAEPAAAAPEVAPALAPAVQAAAKPTLSDSDRRLGGYVLDGVGGALLVGGAISGVLAMTSWDAAKAAKTVPDYQSARDRGQIATVVADALYGIGGAVLAVGLIMTLFPSSTPAPAPASPGAPASQPAPPPVSVSPALLPGGAGVVFAGGF